MSTTTKNTTNIIRRLSTRLRNNPAWMELFTAINNVTRTMVTEPRDRLATIRDVRKYHRGDWITLPSGKRAIINHIAVNEEGSITFYTQVGNTSETVEITLPNNLQDRGVLINHTRYHGFNYFSDTLSEDDYARISDFIERFWMESGTPSYYKFMGFIKHVRLEQDVLWTTEDGWDDDDTYPWLEPNWGQLLPVWLGGTNYPTSHVQLKYDILKFPDTNEFDLFQLFYLLAPIHLVLERIVTDIDGGLLYLETSVAANISLMEGGRATLKDPVVEDDIVVWMGSLALLESGRLPIPRQRYSPNLIVDLIRGDPEYRWSAGDWLWAYTWPVKGSNHRGIGGYKYRMSMYRDLGKLGAIPYTSNQQGAFLGNVPYAGGPFFKFGIVGGGSYQSSDTGRIDIGHIPYSAGATPIDISFKDIVGGIEYDVNTTDRDPSPGPLGPTEPNKSWSETGGIQFGFKLPYDEIVSKSSKFEFELYNEDTLLATYDTDDSTRLYQSGNYLTIYIPPEFMVDWECDTFKFKVFAKIHYSRMEIMTGVINMRDEPLTKNILIDRSVGLKFNMTVKFYGETVQAKKCLFYMKVKDSMGIETVLSMPNGRLRTVSPNLLVGNVSLTDLPILDREYSYELYGKRIADKNNRWCYAKIQKGQITWL